MRKTVQVGNILFEGLYIPEEPMIRYYPDGSGYPGCPAEFDITCIDGEIVDFITDILEPMLQRYNKKVKDCTPVEFDIWEELSNLCVEKVKEEEYDSR